MSGVPASEISATDCPARSRAISFGALALGVVLVIGRQLAAQMPKCVSSFFEWRVSSAAISSARASTASARSEMSARLPIGVATR